MGAEGDSQCAPNKRFNFISNTCTRAANSEGAFNGAGGGAGADHPLLGPPPESSSGPGVPGRVPPRETGTSKDY